MDDQQFSLTSMARFIRRAKERRDVSDVPEVDLDAQPDVVDGQSMPFVNPNVDYQPTFSLLDKAWAEAQSVFDAGEVVSATVTGWNRGGLLVRWDRLQGFVPASQLADVPVFDDDASREEKLSRWVGKQVSLKVIELDRSRNRLVFSERATRWGAKDGEHVLDELAPGDICPGVVSNICDFGAFVDLGGVDGLVHLSELSWGRVTHPREILSIGDRVQVYVMSVDRDRRRVALSLKRMQPDPWTVVEQKYTLGQELDARITNIVGFGAFAQIEEGLEGLVHLSEISAHHLEHPSEVVSPGQVVRVRILRIDSVNHRLGLSMRIDEEESLDSSDELSSSIDERESRWDGQYDSSAYC